MLLKRLPATLPALSVILADICSPSPAALAAALDVHPRTVARWIAADEAPRPIGLALWPLTRWGMSASDALQFNRAELADVRRLVAEQDLELLRRELARVLAAGDFGCANDASQAVRPLAPLMAVRASR
jgi:hypothetical protein